MNADEGATLFESREKQDEFVPSPHLGVSRGEPKAKLLGAFSLVRFFGANKEMNKQKIFKVFFRTLSFAAKKGYPQESRPGVSRPD